MIVLDDIGLGQFSFQVVQTGGQAAISTTQTCSGPRPGPNFICIFDRRISRHVWVECPKLRPAPLLSKANLPGSIDAVRRWVDEFITFILNRPISELDRCPTRVEARQQADDLIRRTNRDVLQNIVRVPLFWRFIWQLILPDRIRIKGDIPVAGLTQGISFISGRPGSEFGEAFAQGPIPRVARLDSRRIAARIKTFQTILNELSPGVLRLIMSGDIWPGYARASGRWLLDLSLPEQEVIKRIRNLGQLADAWSSVPWPHFFFALFLPLPSVKLPPFFKGFAYNDPNLAVSDYFPLSKERIFDDIRNFIKLNEAAFEIHFERQVRAWIADQQKKLEEQQKKGRVRGIVLGIVTGILGLATGGILIPALLTLGKLAVDIKFAKGLKAKGKAAVKKLQSIMGITDAGLEKFREWLGPTEIQPRSQADLNVPGRAEGLKPGQIPEDANIILGITEGLPIVPILVGVGVFGVGLLFILSSKKSN